MKKKTVYALGFFDGVHLGHQALLSACRELARSHGCRAGVVTFSSHPDTLVSGKTPGLINTIPDRERLLRICGMETVIALPFDRALMTTHWSSFLTQLTEHDAAGFVCGSDFRFGAGGSGTAKKLTAFCERHGLPFEVIPQQQLEGTRVSSTYIRSLLERGEMEAAVRFLGHAHIFTGTVAPGRQLGRTMGIPTANIPIPAELTRLRAGVYACTVCLDDRTYAAVTNIGTRPTVEGHQFRAESWLLDYEGDLYGRELTLLFHKFLRQEQKFESLEDLKAQIQKDAAQTRQLMEL